MQNRLKIKSGASIGFELRRWRHGAKCKSATEVWKPLLNQVIAAVFQKTHEKFISEYFQDLRHIYRREMKRVLLVVACRMCIVLEILCFFRLYLMCLFLLHCDRLVGFVDLSA